MQEGQSQTTTVFRCNVIEQESFRRLAKDAHPDHGDKEEFMALRVAYELALRTCSE